MGDGFDAEPADLRAAALGLHGEADALGRALTETRAALNGLGDICGDDDQGRQFAAAYLPKASEAGGALDDAVRVLGAMATNLAASAEQYRTDDQGAHDQVDGTVR